MKTMDWGQVTPEYANTDLNEFYYVYNHDLSSAEKIDRTIRFIIGRLNYYDLHLPPNPKHIVKVDVRGQGISDVACDSMIREIKVRYSRANSLVVEIIKK
jgi:hypothetical protein